jgi:Ca-activated chloride channel family protein
VRFAVGAQTLVVWYIAVPVALAIALGWIVLARRRASARALADPALYARIAPTSAEGVSRARVWLAILAVLALGLAAGRPQMGTRLGVATRRGIDLMLALDVSDSMRAEDLRPDRLEKARREALSLIGLLDGDRVGVITFSGAAFVQCPLTLDYGAASMLLSTVEPGTISRRRSGRRPPPWRRVRTAQRPL